MEKRYRLMFRGELLAGHNPAEVRLAASRRLGANAQQTERLFSGQGVTLKRGLSIEGAARYARELRQLGMRMHVEPDVDAAPKTATGPTDCRIVFQGGLMPGFALEDVKLAASERLHASAAQLVTMFSGRKSTLKKGLDAQQAKRYASRLESIGMQVIIESMSARPPVEEAPPRARSELSHVDTLIHTPLMRASDVLHEIGGQVPADMDFTQTMVDHELIATNAQNALPDLEKTELAGEASLQAYMRGEALPAQHTFEHIPAPPAPRPVSPDTPVGVPVAVYTATAEEAQKPGAEPARNCAGCGARQTRGRYCIHCGHEFSREEKPAGVDAMTPQLVRAVVSAPELVVPEPDMAPRRHKGLLWVGAFVVLVACLTWLKMR